MKTNLAIVACATILGLVLLEVALLFLPQFAPAPRAFPGQYENLAQIHFVSDPVIGWRMKPNHEFTATTSEFTVTYRSNANGFRDDNDYDRHARLPRIVLVGDSFTFGNGVSRENSFAGILQKNLPGFEVENFGMPGFGLDQIWQALRTIGLERKPSLVIVAFVLDDFGRSLTAYRSDIGLNKPMFKVVDGRLVLAGAADAPNPAYRFFERYSRVLAAMTRVVRFVAHWYPIGTWWELNDAILREIGEDCARAGVPVLFVHLPSRKSSFAPALKQAVIARGAAYLDLAGEKFPPGGGLAYPIDGHLNADGHRFVAREMQDWLLFRFGPRPGPR